MFKKRIPEILIIFSVLQIVFSCHHPDKDKENNSYTEREKEKKAGENDNHKTNKNCHFNSIRQLYEDTTVVMWTDEGSFWALYIEKGKVFFDFNPSCGYAYPAELKKEKIVFNWAREMNCNFNRGLDAIFEGVRSPQSGHPFGEIVLLNDSTLMVNYYYKDWVKRINETERSTIDTLFPTHFKQMLL
jgi:hypothetical protein